MVNEEVVDKTLFTIGYSKRTPEEFIGLLKQFGINAVIDVRSAPYSKFVPQYNKDQVEALLKRNGIEYVFLGRELGARPENQSCYVEGKALYQLIAATELFKGGIERIKLGISRGYKISLLCAEKDPLICHRAILVCGSLRGQGIFIRHILDPGVTVTQADLEQRLIAHMKMQPDMFQSQEEFLSRAYELQGDRIAYVMKSASQEGG